MSVKILVVDDESSVIKFLRLSLEVEGFQVVEAHSGREALSTVVSQNPELILLDYGLGDMTGLDVLKNIREWSDVPIIFVTVLDGESEKVAALDAGADDFITKPFGVQELIARVKVALRHSKRQITAKDMIAGPLSIDFSGHIVLWKKVELKLTQTEFLLLACLAKSYGKVVPHRLILSEVWGPNAVEHHHYLRVYFGQLRKKLEAIESGAGNIIVNESGVGYRLLVDMK